MNWKEQFNKEWGGLRYDGTDVLFKKFISTQIIEKLIEDIPDNWGPDLSYAQRGELFRKLKQQLRDKWL